MEILRTLAAFTFLLFTETFSAKAPLKSGPRITRRPQKSITVLVGNDLKLEWMFEFKPVDTLERVSLFKYSIESKAKLTIALKDYGSNQTKYNPQANGQHECDIRLGKNGIGIASIVTRNIQFSHSGDYGVGLESRNQQPPKIEHSVLARVVDMVAIEKSVTSRTITSWVGRKTSLTCKVIHRGTSVPSFRWFKTRRGEVTEGVTSSYNTSVLNIVPRNRTDFGKYICEASTKIATVIQRYLVVKLDYPGPPTAVQSRFYEERVVHTVIWKHASKKYVYEAKKYVIEIWDAAEKRWKLMRTVSILSMSFENLKSTTRVRVCSANEMGYTESSCSAPIVLVVPESVTGSPGKRNNSCQSTPCSLLLFIAIMLSTLTLTMNDSGVLNRLL